jgi:uncharacterized protein YqiB (DUF1249 family)
MTYKFDIDVKNKPAVLPNLYIRVYFDAMQAEVLKRDMKDVSHNRYNHRRLGNKWRDNRFLYKWLDYCLGQGHSFLSKNGSINSF